MEYLLDTALNWWDRHDTANEIRLFHWYKKLIRKYPTDEFTFRDGPLHVNAKDVLFFFIEDNPINPLISAVKDDYIHYQNLFLRYKEINDINNKKQKQLKTIIRDDYRGKITPRKLTRVLQKEKELNHTFLIDDYKPINHVFLGFGVLNIVKINQLNTPWFDEEITTIPKKSRSYPIKAIGDIGILCELIESLRGLKSDIGLYIKTLERGFNIAGISNTYIRFTEPYYTRYNGQFFILLENAVHRLICVLIRFLKRSVSNPISVNDKVN